MDGNNPLGGAGSIPPDLSVTGPQNVPTFTAPSGSPQQPPVNPVAARNAAVVNQDVSEHYGIGRAFKSLLGSTTNYQVNPQTGEMVAVQAPKTRGSLMKGILAGALLGSAAGANESGFMRGFAKGGAAGIEDQRNQDLLRQKQAQTQFENQIKANEEKRKDAREAREEALNKAQIAYHNAATLRENQLLQNSDFEFHEKVATSGKTQLQPFIDAGLPYAFKDKPESEMNDLIKNNPNAAHLMWEPTGTRIVIGADGKPNVEALYSAVDPKGSVKVTDAQIKQWKEDGLDQFYGSSFFDVLKKGKELDASQYMAINQKDQELTNKKLSREKADLDLEKEKATINLNKAQALHDRAEASKAFDEIKEKKEFDDAWAMLTTGGDISKLDVKKRAALTKGITEIQGQIERQIHELPKDAATNAPLDQDRAKQLYDVWDQYQGIQNKLYGVDKKLGGGSTRPASPEQIKVQVGGQSGTVSKDKLDQFLADNPDAEVVTEPHLSATEQAIKGGTVKELPDASTVDAGYSIYTNGKGSYIIRRDGFKNPQWKVVSQGQNTAGLGG